MDERTTTSAQRSVVGYGAGVESELRAWFTTDLTSALAFAGIGLFVALVAALHVLEPDFDPASRYMSEYATADTGLLMRIAFFSLGTAIAAIATGLARALAPGKRVKASVVLLYVSAAGIYVSGVFDSDVVVDGEVEEATVAGVLHDLAGFAAFAALIVVGFMLRGVFARDPRWVHRARPQLGFAIAVLVLFLVFAGSPPEILGATQRVFIPVVLAWLTTLAWWTRKTPAVAARGQRGRARVV